MKLTKYVASYIFNSVKEQLIKGNEEESTEDETAQVKIFF